MAWRSDTARSSRSRGECQSSRWILDDGSEVWATDLRTQNDSEGITIQPIVFDGRVYVSTVPGHGRQRLLRGRRRRASCTPSTQETGEVVWNFSTVDSADLWGNPEVNSGGGAWYPPTIEVQSGRTFWGIGNPAPYPGNEEFPSGSSRPGRNLYTDSVMAMTSDGQLDWFTQVRRHDLYDLDFQLSPILAQVPIAGDDAEGDRDVVIGGGKNGEIVAMDRTTGEILWRTSVGTHKNENVDPVPASGIEVYPARSAASRRRWPSGTASSSPPTSMGRPSTRPVGSSPRRIDERTGGIVAVDATNGQLLWETHVRRDPRRRRHRDQRPRLLVDLRRAHVRARSRDRRGGLDDAVAGRHQRLAGGRRGHDRRARGRRCRAHAHRVAPRR